MEAWLAAICALTLAVAANVAGAAELTFFATRSDFDAAEPGLPVQSFDSANLLGQPYVTQASPLSAATNDAVFAKGSILRGLTIRTLHPGSVSTALIVYGGGPVGSISVGNNWYGDTLLLSFVPGVTAVAEDVFANTASGPSFAGPITVQIFAGGKSLGARSFKEAAGGSVFVGAASATAITRVAITWGGDNDATTFVSNVAFGTPAAAP